MQVGLIRRAIKPDRRFKPVANFLAADVIRLADRGDHLIARHAQTKRPKRPFRQELSDAMCVGHALFRKRKGWFEWKRAWSFLAGMILIFDKMHVMSFAVGHLTNTSGELPMPRFLAFKKSAWRKKPRAQLRRGSGLTSLAEERFAAGRFLGVQTLKAPHGKDRRISFAPRGRRRWVRRSR